MQDLNDMLFFAEVVDRGENWIDRVLHFGEA